MADKKGHLFKYKINKKLLNTDEMNIDTNSHYEWVITVAFYSVLHLIESILFEKYDMHPKDHAERNKMFLCDTQLKNIRNDYNIIQTSCWKARYSSGRSSKNDAARALEILNNIEQFTQKVLNESF